MKISEVVKYLDQIKEEEGDLEVVITSGDGEFRSPVVDVGVNEGLGGSEPAAYVCAEEEE